MTKDIILTISGLYETDGISDDPVEIITPGQYFLKNGKHYVQFTEVLEGVEGEIRSLLKFDESCAELIRNGAANTRMAFRREQDTRTLYHTPMGMLSLSIYTEELNLTVREELIDVEIIYTISADGNVVTENEVKLSICPKELKILENDL
ncbi:MAG: DUF1934 domain-containing protein [Lachnospiraceae bacterium]